MARPNRSDYQETQEHISFASLDDFGVPNFRTSQYQTDSNSVWLTVPCWIFNSSISHKRQDAQLRDGNAWRGRSMHAQTSRLQLATFKSWAVLGSPTKKMLMLSYQSPELRYSCSQVWLLNAAICCLSLVNPLSACACNSQHGTRASWAIRWWWPYRQQNNQNNPILSTRPMEQVMQPCNQLMRCLWHCSSLMAVYCTDSIPVHRMRFQK